MKDQQDYVRGNIPELVWDQLKIIARQEASSGHDPAIDECVRHVETVAANLVGSPGALPSPVVRFYAEELQARIESLLNSLGEG